MGSPSLLAAQSGPLLRRHNLLVGLAAMMAVGGVISDGGITQATGDNGALNFDIDTTAIIDSLVNGEQHVLAAQTDADSDAGDAVTWGGSSDKFVRFAVVLETGSDNDTPAVVAIPGDVADTEAACDEPDSDAISDELTHSNWVLIGVVLIERTAATAVTVTIEGGKKYGGIRFEDGIDLAETEAAFSA